MSISSIRSAIEAAINSITPALPTAWENTSFVPVEGTPYQRVTVHFDDPIHPEVGTVAYRELGFIVIKLYYPLKKGSKDAEERATLIRSTFPHANRFDGVEVRRTPSISGGRVEGNNWLVMVTIYFEKDESNG